MYASRVAGDYLAAPEASAAPAAADRLPAIMPLPRAELRAEPAAELLAPPTVFGAPDAELLAPLGAAKVTRAKLNQGGTTISLRLDFANGARAAFKPEQI